MISWSSSLASSAPATSWKVTFGPILERELGAALAELERGRAAGLDLPDHEQPESNDEHHRQPGDERLHPAEMLGLGRDLGLGILLLDPMQHVLVVERQPHIEVRVCPPLPGHVQGGLFAQLAAHFARRRVGDLLDVPRVDLRAELRVGDLRLGDPAVVVELEDGDREQEEHHPERQVAERARGRARERRARAHRRPAPGRVRPSGVVPVRSGLAGRWIHALILEWPRGPRSPSPSPRSAAMKGRFRYCPARSIP